MDDEEKLSDLELQYENLEQQHFLSVAVLFGIIIHLWLGGWILAVGLPVLGYLVGWKFLAKRPFTNGIRND